MADTNNSVGIGTGYQMDDPGSISSMAGFFSSPHSPDRLWGTPSLVSNGYRGAISPRIKRPEHEVDHSTPSSAEVKNGAATIFFSICLHDIVFD
jgi:hypothetical protein